VRRVPCSWRGWEDVQKHVHQLSDDSEWRDGHGSGHPRGRHGDGRWWRTQIECGSPGARSNGWGHRRCEHASVASSNEGAVHSLEGPCLAASAGRAGQTINQIMQQSQSRIQISQKGEYVPGTRNRQVTVTGTTGAIDVATALIKQRLGEEAQKTGQMPPDLTGGCDGLPQCPPDPRPGVGWLKLPGGQLLEAGRERVVSCN
jgi:hypothetical protein